MGVTAAAASAHAQASVVWMDVGGATLRQPGGTDRRAATAGVGGVYRRGAWTLIGEGALSLAEDSLGAAQAVARAAYAPGRWRWSTTEVEASATSFGVAWPGTNGNQGVRLRQSLQTGAVRLFAAAGFGKTLRFDPLTQRFDTDTRGRVISLGASGMRGPLTGTVTLQRATTDDWQLMEASGIILKRVAPWYGLHDAEFELTWQSRRLAFTASRSWRAGFGDTQGTGNGYAVSGAWRVSSPLQFIVHGGKQLADPLRGVPQAHYAGIMARVQRSRNVRAPSARAAASAARDAEFLLTPRTGGGDLVIRVDAPRDATVEVATSATDWTPQQLVHDGEQFVARVALASGTHRVAVRVNGGAWRAPRGLTRVEDEFGGAAGMVVVP